MQVTNDCGQLRLLFWRTPHPSLWPLRQCQPRRQYRLGPPAPRRTRPVAVERRQRRHRKSSPRQRVERLSLLRRAHDHHRDLRTRVPAAAMAHPIDRARQFMTITPPLAIPHHRSHPASLSHRQRPRFAHSDPRRHLRPTNLQHQTPDHRTNPIQSAQTQRPPGRSTVVLSETHKSDQPAATNSP